MTTIPLLLALATLVLANSPQPLRVTYSYYFPLIADNSTNKAGLAWAYRGQNDVSGLGVSFYQDWLIGGEGVQGLTHVPHLACRYWPYGSTEETAQTHYLADLQAIQPYTDTILFLNEPDLTGQCKMTSEAAVTLFTEALAICPACQFTLPQVSHIDYQSGWKWVRGFITEYQQQMGELPPVSYGSFHIYNLPVTPALDSYEAMLQGEGYIELPPILITETGACTPDMTTQMITELKADARVEGWFWYSPAGGTCTDLFMGLGSSELTPIGQAFMAVK